MNIDFLGKTSNLDNQNVKIFENRSGALPATSNKYQKHLY